jgi:hypothetical protein
MADMRTGVQPDFESMLAPSISFFDTVPVACIKLPRPEKMAITFPGMGELQAIADSITSVRRPSDIILSALNSWNVALAPLNAIIRFVNIAQAVLKCIKAIKESITQLSPDPMLDCIGNLVKAVAALLPFIPPLAYVRMICQIITAVRVLLDDLLNVITLLDNQISVIKIAIQRGIDTNDNVLIEIGECAKQNAEEYVRGIMQVVVLIAEFIGLLMTFLEVLAEFLPDDVGKRVEKVNKALTDATDAVGSRSLGDFGPLAFIVEVVSGIRESLMLIEEVLCNVVGLTFLPLSVQNLNLKNPG